MQPVTSEAWMLASTQKAGFSECGPVAVFVTVASQMSRPSNDRPMLSRANSSGCSSAQPRRISVSSS